MQDCTENEDETYCHLFINLYPSKICSIAFDSNLSTHTKVCPMSGSQNLQVQKNCTVLATLTFNFFESRNQSMLADKHKTEYCVYDSNDCNLHHDHAYGEHLMSCEQYYCPKKYLKCPGFYCIPWRFVCNGYWECPGGTEERGCQRTACPGMYRCKNSSICISNETICDSTQDCHLNDDEHFCPVNQMSNNCPSNFSSPCVKHRAVDGHTEAKM